MRLAKIEMSFLKSRVARRVFSLFVFCALLPLIALSGFSFFFMSGELEEQAVRRLRQTCKAKGFEIYEHLLFLETEMKMIASNLKNGGAGTVTFVPYASDKGAGSRFLGLLVLKRDGSITKIRGDMEPVPQIGDEEKAHLEAGRTLIVTRPKDPLHTVYMARRMDPKDLASPLLLAEVNPIYLWGVGSEGSLSPEVDLVVHNREHQVLITSLPAFQPNEGRKERPRNSSTARHFEFELEGEHYIAAHWDLFIKPRFFVPSWTIILSESRSSILAPVKSFEAFFLLLTLLTFWVVALLSVMLIRKSLVPIETLRTATERIAGGELGTQVEIDSNDEFEALGRSFNQMSEKLEQGRKLLVQSAKMSAFGQMAAGVVHEIGQPLTSLQGLVELILDGPLEQEQREDLETIQSELRRLQGMIAKFRSFSKIPEGVQEPVDLNQVLEDTHRLLEHQFEMKGVHCVMEKAEDLPVIRGDANGLQQILVNLLINAMDALEDQPDGRRLIEVRTDSPEDRRVRLSVSDSGPGIPEDIRGRIFDPFFTTKATGEGTGLGLAIITSILHQHNATIQLDSDPATGSRFVLEFPAHPPSET